MWLNNFGAKCTLSKIPWFCRISLRSHENKNCDIGLIAISLDMFLVSVSSATFHFRAKFVTFSWKNLKSNSIFKNLWNKHLTIYNSITLCYDEIWDVELHIFLLKLYSNFGYFVAPFHETIFRKIDQSAKLQNQC